MIDNGVVRIPAMKGGVFHKDKHSYKRIEDGKICGMSWQRHQCEDCKKIVGLDDWQIVDLPTDMLYEKV